MSSAFSRLPGIGPKTASRLTYYLIRVSADESKELSEALRELKDGTTFCANCFNITSVDLDPCEICSDHHREIKVLCVVEDPLDVLAIERTGKFSGRYHVLHGAISPVEGVGPEDLKIDELIARLGRDSVEEVILATNPTLEGEATAMFLKHRFEGHSIRLTRLARGLPSGGDLEYADPVTLTQALEGRQEM